MPLARSAVPCALVILGCASPSEPVAPTCPESVKVDLVAPVDSAAPTEAVAPEPAPEPDPLLATLDYNKLKIAVRVGERASESEEPTAYVRIEVAHEGVDIVDVVERDIHLTDCLVEHLEPAIDIVFNDGLVVVVDASVRCVFGEMNMRMNHEHTVIATREREPGLGVIYEGSSRYTNRHHGLAVTLDKREFYVEAGELAVYRHSVEWCDEQGMQAVFGHGCNKSRPRKLQLLERVSIAVPVSD
jgi:hypothetical protein